jgi:hypothetical protein
MAAADSISFDNMLYHVTLSGTYPPRPSCIVNRDVHLLKGTVDSKAGGIVRVHVTNGTIPDYDLVFGPAIPDRGFLVHNVTANLPCNSTALTAVKGYAGCQDPSRGPVSSCGSILFEDNPSPDVPPHYHWLLTLGINPPLPPAVCNEFENKSSCDAASKCRWCTSKDGGHKLCFEAGHTPGTGWTCS